MPCRRILMPLPVAALLAAALLVVPALAAAWPVPASAGGRSARGAAPEGVLLVGNGSPARRITLVLVGDGYTAAELPRFRNEADAVWKALTEVEPFHTYQRFFDVRRVDLVSPRSGLHSGSPLGMHFGCEGVTRLLCADPGALVGQLGPADGPRYVIALANSASYGGEGGSDRTATVAADSPSAGPLVQHEMGHTVGGLGDEYDAAPADPGFPNVAADDAATLRARQLKWWRWLGADDPTGGQVGAYRSANGLFRPTRDSIMRTLGGSYNLPCREAIIESLYRQVWLIDRTEPAPGPVAGRPTLRVFPVPLVGPRQLVVSWQVDGHAPPAGAVGPDGFDTSRLALGPDESTEVSATVSDTTPGLRDEAFRARRMTGTVRWTLHG
ncbi:M64 family metallopeptidase [Streptacidiphilus sp. EB129]|uniref:M64 family metallopeptidase n=1 Tax=Streptacidiphilus sp. EB129 TaxID=3156262 RepID=UPI003512BBA6